VTQPPQMEGGIEVKLNNLMPDVKGRKTMMR